MALAVMYPYSASGGHDILADPSALSAYLTQYAIISLLPSRHRALLLFACI